MEEKEIEKEVEREDQEVTVERYHTTATQKD